MARRWTALAPDSRRRIVLGALVAASLATLDVISFLFASGLFALGEMAPAPARHAQLA